MLREVTLFVTCIVDQLFPRVGIAMAEVLESLGYSVNFLEDQTCWGQPAFNSGYLGPARDAARHFLTIFEDAEFVVIPSGSCATMSSRHFAELFPPGDPFRAKALAMSPKIFEFSKFLTDIAKAEDVGARFEGTVTYHDSCHALRELHVIDGPRRLLSRVRGLELREMDVSEECCGFGGTFSVKFAEISGGMARTKIDSILKTGAKTVVSIDSSCLMQLQGAISRAGLPIQTLHLAEVLASR